MVTAATVVSRSLQPSVSSLMLGATEEGLKPKDLRQARDRKELPLSRQSKSLKGHDASMLLTVLLGFLYILLVASKTEVLL